MTPSPASPRVRARVFLCVCALAVAAFLGIPGAEAKGGLQNAQHNLAQAQQQAKVLGNQISHNRSRLAQIQTDVKTLQGEIKIAAAEYKQILDQLTQTQTQQDQTKAQFDDVTAVMNSRARTTFEDGPAGGLAFLLDATSLSNLSARQQFIDALQAQDANNALKLHNLSAQLRSQAKKEKELKDAKQAVLNDLQSKHQQLASRQQQAHSAIQQLQGELVRAHHLEKKYQHKVNVIIAKQSGGTGGPSPFDVCPVPNFSSISNDFGALRYTTVPPHPHEGNDIMAPRGADIVAPFDGVAKDSSDSLGGNAVYVYGHGGYVYNAHLESYGQTGHVNAGDVIGHVGNTGDAAGGPTHDHFEWHPGGGAAVDPHAYLLAVC